MKDKCSKGNIFIITFLSADAVLFAYLLKHELYSEIPLKLTAGLTAAFILEAAVLLLIQTKNVFIKIIKIFIIILLNISIFSAAGFCAYSEVFIFHPHFDEESYNSLKSYNNISEYEILSSEGKISGFCYDNAGEDAPVVLYFYGNGEDASSRLLKILTDGSLEYFKDYNIAIFDYPGYGKSEGVPNEESLKAFGLAVYDSLKKDNREILIHGYSIGTGVANYVASEREVKGLVLFAPYADGYDIFNYHFDIFHGPLMRTLVSFKMESIVFAGKIKVPVLIFASETDRLVSYASSERLSKAYENKTFVTTEDMDHDGFWNNKNVMFRYSCYLQEVS